ncbi:PIN-like domain-containing protein [Paenibacillus apiarius]|uniref:PIN-like domain-containing protein n=1 Tax=Paenibacillus apiarius TaxID=46240 RepID=UPI003B3B4C8D
MHKLLNALLPRTKEQKKRMWESALFVVDANILLSLYKYSNSTRSEFIGIMGQISDRLWIPHQVALEFLHNRTKKIDEQVTEYKNHIEAVKQAKTAAKKEIDANINGIKKPFRKFNVEALTAKIDVFFEGLIKEIEASNSDNPDFYKNDIVLEQFLKFYSNRIGDPFSEDELKAVYSEGEERYSKKIPPGYEDLKDKQGEFKVFENTVIKSEYGDLILWKQIINKSNTDKKAVIFITDDSKEDWREKEKGKKVPRKELINEFTTITGQDFLMYTSESFLKDARIFLQMDVNDSTIAEVHRIINSINEKDIEKYTQLSLFDMEDILLSKIDNTKVNEENINLINKYMNLLKEETRLNKKRVELEMEIKNNSASVVNEDSYQMSLQRALLKEQFKALSKKKSELIEELKNLL